MRNDGSFRRTEKIFKIIKEKPVEIDSEDEESEAEDDISRSCEVDKDQYKSVYRKSKNLIKKSLDNSYLRSTNLISLI